MKQNLNFKKKLIQSKRIIKKTFDLNSQQTAILWVEEKNTITLLHLVKSYLNNIPFPVFFYDSTKESDETYGLLKTITSKWMLNLVITEPLKTDLKKFYNTLDLKKKEKILIESKKNALSHILNKSRFSSFLIPTNNKSQVTKSKKYYSFIKKDHSLIYPLLHFSNNDINTYLHKFELPSTQSKNSELQPSKSSTKPITQETKKLSKEHKLIIRRLNQLDYW